VFLSSDRSIIDKLIAGILSRWWCVVLCCMPPSAVPTVCRRYGIEWPPANYQPSVDKTWKPLVGFSFVCVILQLCRRRAVCNVRSDGISQVRGARRPYS
jgi:hypothetical protein